MTPEQFKQAQLRLGLKNQPMADLLGVTIGYVEMLRSEKSGKRASLSLQRIIEQAERLKALDT
jgi:predicted transcriptional regulator